MRSWRHLVRLVPPLGLVLLLAFSGFTPYPETLPVEGAGGGGKKDTVRATVLYGETNLFESIADLSDDAILRYKDSLQNLPIAPLELISQIDLYLTLKYKEETEIVSLIDSLFDQDEIPFALINEINMYIANHEEAPPEEVLPKNLFMGNDSGPYPAHHLYGSWNTTNPNPYPNSITVGDTFINVLLQGTDDLGTFEIPVENVITSNFGWRHGRNHNGIDVDLEVWDPVKAAFPGMVRVAGWYGGYGRVVVVRHYNGLETLYAHLHRFKVEPGEVVESGQVLGLGGSSGKSTGSHLHFEVRFKGKPINPLNFIAYKEHKLINDTLMLKKTKFGYAAFPKGTTIHTVARGEYLYLIAEKYGTTIQKLCEMNGIRRASKLYVGQRLRVI